jgi:hypothetical protein
MIAAILATDTLAKVILYSLLAGAGIPAAFALGVSSTVGLLDAFRQGRTAAGALWALTAFVCVVVSALGVVLGIVIMTAGKP